MVWCLSLTLWLFSQSPASMSQNRQVCKLVGLPVHLKGCLLALCHDGLFCFVKMLQCQFHFVTKFPDFPGCHNLGPDSLFQICPTKFHDNVKLL